MEIAGLSLFLLIVWRESVRFLIAVYVFDHGRLCTKLGTFLSAFRPVHLLPGILLFL